MGYHTINLKPETLELLRKLMLGGESCDEAVRRLLAELVALRVG